MNINNIQRNSNGGASQACSACKYQRRKCGPTCILARYFPHDRQQQFLNAHKLFGVGKITNMLKNVPPESRDMTMSSIVYQSDMRAMDPVGGCYRHILHLQSQIDYYSAHLHYIHQQLAICRAASASASAASASAATNNHHHHHYNDNNDITHAVNHYQQQQHFVVEEQLNDVSMFQPQPQPQPQYVVDDAVGINPNYLPLQEDLDTWVNSIPLSPLSLQDNKKEVDEVDQERIDDDHLNDEKPVFDLINGMNSSDIIRSSPRHQL